MADFKFKNTHRFREAAIHFEKHKCYTFHIPGTFSYYEFWDEEKRRCTEGYIVNGVRITGYHYFYLNYCPIIQVKAIGANDGIKKQAAERIEGFPKFWDLDWRYFTALDIAEYGISEEDYKKLPIDIDLVLDEDNTSGGKHFIWLKPRGVGASWKGASMPARNFFFVKNSKSYMFAESTEYLNKDGIFSKFLLYKNFINEHTPFYKYTDVKNDLNKMHLRASHKDMKGNEIGFMSEVMGVAVEGKDDKVRGKRGKITLFEEFGAFTNADKCIEVSKSSHEEGNLVFGTMVCFGTGGTEGKAFESMEKLFFNPISQGMLRFHNVYDDDLIGTECGFFTPATFNVAFIDEEGNTDRVKSKAFLDKEREKKLKSPDPNDAARAKAEHPYTPQEALLRTSSNIFPKAELLSWKTELVSTRKAVNLAIYGDLEDTKSGVKFRPNPDARPVMKYPHDKKEDNSGCITIWETPFRKEGVIYDNMYILVVDPYMHDTTTGDSLGAAYVIKNINPLSQPDDIIVASLVGRPATMDIFHKKVRQLSEYYNAKIGFENNAGQALLAYFKANRKMHLLAPEFSLGFNENIPKSGVRRGYGMHIDQRRKEIGLSYLADWLIKEWTVTEEGEVLYNYHKIYDIGLLEELIKFNPDNNYDRISAMVVGMFHQKEIEWKYGNKAFAKTQSSAFFTTVHYQ